MQTGIILAIDVVLLTIKNDKLHVGLIKRESEPYKAQYALPGGYIHKDEDASCTETALRVLDSKMHIKPPYLEQLKTFSGQCRDPRGWSISVAYFALVPLSVMDDSISPLAMLVDIEKLGALPFDHRQIIDEAVSRVRNKSQYSSLPCHLAGDTFTLPALQKLYEACLGEPLNKSQFRRKLEAMNIVDEQVGEQVQLGAHRPAKVYRLKASYLETLKVVVRGL